MGLPRKKFMDRFFLAYCDGCNRKLIDLEDNRTLTVAAVYVCDACRKVWCRGCSPNGHCPRCKAPVEKYEGLLDLLHHIIRWDTMQWRKFPLKKKGDDEKCLLVTVPARYSVDDVKAKCSQCGIDVYASPNGMKKAKEEGWEIVCVGCAKKRAKQYGNYKVAITEKTIREVLEHFDRKDWRKDYV